MDVVDVASPTSKGSWHHFLPHFDITQRDSGLPLFVVVYLHPVTFEGATILHGDDPRFEFAQSGLAKTRVVDGEQRLPTRAIVGRDHFKLRRLHLPSLLGGAAKPNLFHDFRRQPSKPD